MTDDDTYKSSVHLEETETDMATEVVTAPASPPPPPRPPTPTLEPWRRRGNQRHELLDYFCPVCGAPFIADIARNFEKGTKVRLKSNCSHVHYKWTTTVSVPDTKAPATGKTPG